jgi:hypothetical protein
MADHVAGQVQPPGFSIPIDYTVEGEAQDLPKVGKSFQMMRDTRNGVRMLGVFVTSPVVEVTETTFRTANSVYDYSLLTDPVEVV